MARHPRALAGTAALGGVYAALHGVGGPHAQALRAVDAWAAWCAYWVVLGVLSSVGLGAGLHTFVLFLGPHIARVTLTAHECAGVAFAVRGAGAFQCAAGAAAGPVAFAAIMRKVIVESLCWGAGTAVGELPPYFIARAAAAAADGGGSGSGTGSGTGGGTAEVRRLERSAAAGGPRALKDRALLGVHRLLRRFGFAGILLFAAIPNPLFDLAGITCGHFGVPFWTFFGATFVGKSLIKSTLQSSVVVAAFSRDAVAAALGLVARLSPRARDLAERVLRQQAAALGAPAASAAAAAPSSLLGAAWSACISAMLVYFVVTALEAFAQAHIAQARASRATTPPPPPPRPSPALRPQ